MTSPCASRDHTAKSWMNADADGLTVYIYIYEQSSGSVKTWQAKAFRNEYPRNRSKKSLIYMNVRQKSKGKKKKKKGIKT